MLKCSDQVRVGTTIIILVWSNGFFFKFEVSFCGPFNKNQLVDYIEDCGTNEICLLQSKKAWKYLKRELTKIKGEEMKIKKNPRCSVYWNILKRFS